MKKKNIEEIEEIEKIEEMEEMEEKRKEKERKETNKRGRSFFCFCILFFHFFSIFLSSYSYGVQSTEIETDSHDKVLAIQHEKSRVKRRVRDMVSFVRKGDYASAISASVDQEKEAYQQMDRALRLHGRGGKLTKHFQKFFKQLKGFWIEWVEIDEVDREKALAICIFRFKFFDKESKKPIFKDREVYYYLRKVLGTWKISFSRLKYERYVYPKRVRDTP